jgi:D-galactose 1-dehydrogenase
MTAVRLALVGLGKIARDQHLPAITSNPDYQLAATVDPSAPGGDMAPHYPSLTALLEGGVAVDAVVICTPPQVRYNLASQAIAAGLHVFLEKPPGASVEEVMALEDQCRATGVTLFAAWHSRYAAGVGSACAWLVGRDLRRVEIVWREDVRQWHPRQDWIWRPGGLGVFDPGINALSILTRLLPQRIFLTAAELFVPENRAAPIAAKLDLRDAAGISISMDLDFRQVGLQSWDIGLKTAEGGCVVSQGGAMLTHSGGVERYPDVEYVGLYSRFADLIRRGASDVDLAPLRLVADAFLLGERTTVEPFFD